MVDNDDTLRGSSSRSDRHQIKLHKNGDLKVICVLKSIFQNYQDISQLKRRILKKLDISTYEDKNTQQSLRIFSIRGIEYCDYDSIEQLKGVHELFYTFGEDYNYQIRLNTLQFKKELG